MKYGLDHLVGGRQVEPDLEQLERVGPVAVEQREHLGVDDAAARGEPLHVAATEARGGAERIGVVDEPGARTVTVSKPRCGCCGKPGTVLPWYIRQPSMPAKSMPMSRPSSEAAGPMRSLPSG